MSSLWSLFKRQPQRHFARLDAQGLCQALKCCEQPPVGAGWVEVGESDLRWLNRPLPASARVVARRRGNLLQRALAA
ncbi:hypothetical protein V0R50_06770 [Pseudomonas sp. 148P]|uniref:Uncharacterized protein n=1 Tax=Pseudomonas ulcerans TaxID=3115852 RepID=A0ABU7HN13_9PSED|nr:MULTISPECIES: hypothetical protein [unclassified Pseudomonas]MEE1922443.1 hypothetical protein [Pseudomonas sp. 147P]MEE1932917.1 hypothetical protein [Pseudomonas sp. 148P]